jgi:hypothetical protein
MSNSVTPQDDYQLCFSLEELEDRGPRQGYDEDPLIRMVQLFLGDLLEIGQLTWKGELVAADGFVLTATPDRIYEIAPSPPEQAAGASENREDPSDPMKMPIL